MTTSEPVVLVPGNALGRIIGWMPARCGPVSVLVETSRLGVVLRPEHAPEEPVGLPVMQARRVAGALLVADGEAVVTAIVPGPEPVASLMVSTFPALGGKAVTVVVGGDQFVCVLPSPCSAALPAAPQLTPPKEAGEFIARAAEGV
ncbi:hypothetical protein [Actinoalloteichus spitiensis]|uniref:hypothetical protein n=1 Tax=Actinoalloteichus spitiensis TaxID=252394 RepID=UPI00037EF084|nr:hypothetical protein [Actinoalloteichus spitiensis]